MNIWGILKLVVASVAFVVLITFLTVEPPKQNNNAKSILQDMPKTVQLVGDEKLQYNTNSIINKNSIIFVGNSQTMGVAKSLLSLFPKQLKNLVVVSNISDEPWFLKEYQEYDNQNRLKGNDTTPWIFDKDGSMRSFLKVPTSNPLSYFVYSVQDDQEVKLIYQYSFTQLLEDRKLDQIEVEKSLQELKNILENK